MVIPEAADSELRRMVADTPIADRCPYLRTDAIGPYCGAGHIQGRPVSEERRAACDRFELMTWCLDKQTCQRCLWYKGDEKFSDQ